MAKLKIKTKHATQDFILRSSFVVDCLYYQASCGGAKDPYKSESKLVKKGQHVMIIKYSGCKRWVLIKAGGITNWITNDFLEKIVNITIKDKEG